MPNTEKRPLTIEESHCLKALLLRADHAGQISLGRIERGIFLATVHKSRLRVGLADNKDGDAVDEITIYHPSFGLKAK